MASPGDETAAGAESHTRLRASAADHEQAIEVLKVAFVQDRITKDELDQRIGKVLASRTYDDLDPYRRHPHRSDESTVDGARATIR